MLPGMILSFCDRKGTDENIYEDKIVNQTDKELVIVSYFDVCNDSAYCYCNDSVSPRPIRYVTNWMFKRWTLHVGSVKL